MQFKDLTSGSEGMDRLATSLKINWQSFGRKRGVTQTRTATLDDSARATLFNILFGLQKCGWKSWIMNQNRDDFIVIGTELKCMSITI